MFASHVNPLSMKAHSKLAYAYLFVEDAARTIDFWENYLDHCVSSTAKFSAPEAKRLGVPHLKGEAITWLENQARKEWLCLIQTTGLPKKAPFHQAGWAALELNVSNCETVYKRLASSPVRILGKPTPLALSEDIIAMQACGFDDELLYLTEIKAATSTNEQHNELAFELPKANKLVDDFFIAVCASSLSKQNTRDANLNFYTDLLGRVPQRVDTVISVVNQSLDRKAGANISIATIQLQANTLIEVDDFENLDHYSPRRGIALVGLISSKPTPHDAYLIEHGPYTAKYGSLHRGPSGELIEQIYENKPLEL